MIVCPATMSRTFLGTRNSSRSSQVQKRPENRSTSSLGAGSVPAPHQSRPGTHHAPLAYTETHGKNRSPLAAASGHSQTSPVPPTVGVPRPHLLGRLTKKAKATMRRKLKILSLYSSSPTAFSQHWSRGGPVTPGPQPPLPHPRGGGPCGGRARPESDRVTELEPGPPG